MMEDPDAFEYVSLTEKDTLSCLSETRNLGQRNHSLDSREDFRCDPPGTNYCWGPKPGPWEDSDAPSSEKSPRKLDKIFMHLEEEMMRFVKEQLREFHRLLDLEYGDNTSESEQLSTHDSESTAESEEEQRSREAVLNLTLSLLRRMDQEEMARLLRNNTEVRVCRDKMKRHLQQRFSQVIEGVANEGTPTCLNQIYTELYITEGGASEVNQEHEVRYIETTSRYKAETPIKCEDIFKQWPDSKESTRTVLTKGVTGMGKTMLTQKFSLNWAEGRSNQDIQLLFPFTFKELNVLRDKQYSLEELLHHCFSPTKGICNFQQLQVLFIFDGLDECRLPLDFSQTQVLTEPTESASVDVLLVNLIRGSLLPFARLWITTRPAAANQIPAECISMETEVRGFTNPQKEQYFRKRFSDKQQAAAIISHIRKFHSLYIMCHLPIFCWILSTALHNLMGTKKRGELPHTLTQMYIRFLVVQAKVTNIKYHDGSGADHHWSPEIKKMVWSLAKLAFEQLQKGHLVFYERDLNECGMDAAATSVYSGVLTQIFREDPGQYQEKVYCFIHLTVQEFLAALHVHQTFTESGLNLLEEKNKHPALAQLFKHKYTSSQFHRFAVDKALQSPNGHLDLFLRFLLGLSLPTNERLLSGLLTPSKCDLTYKATWYIKKNFNEGLSAERSLNLLHCLNELNNHSLEEHIQSTVREGLNQFKSPAQWSALCFHLLFSDSDLEEFDLRRYHSSEKTLLKLLPVVKASTKAILRGCGLSSLSCGPLASVLSSSSLTNLDLSNNNIHDTGVQQLWDGMKNATSLHTLSLSSCDLSSLSCGPLASVLSSSSLTLLDLSYNDLQDSGVKLLCEGLKSALCRLQTLRLSGCLVSEKGGAYLTSALSLASSCLKELDLRYNYPGPCATLLTALRDDLHRPLDKLRLDPCEERFLVPGLRKYSCEFSLNINTAHCNLVLSVDKHSVIHVEKGQKYPDHEDRFTDFYQVLGSTGLSGRCYWEVTWTKRNSQWSDTCSEMVQIAVTYRRIRRSGDTLECSFGNNNHSWSLRLMDGKYSIWQNSTETSLSKGSSRRVGVFLDTEAGVLSFYQVLSDGQLSHLHTINTPFTEPVFPGFGIGPDTKVTLVNRTSFLPVRITRGYKSPPK